MGSQKQPKVRRPDGPKQQQKRLEAEERLRRSLQANKGVAANILAAADAFGSGKAERTLLGGSDLLGGR